MKIGFIFYKYPLYPKGSYFQEFLNSFAGVEGVEKIFLMATRYPSGKFKKHRNIKIFWIPLINTPFIGEIFFMFLCFLKAIFTKELHKINICNSIGPRGLLAGWYLKKRYKIPLVCTIEMINEKGSLINNIYYEFVFLLLTKAPIDKFICWSNYYWENHLRRRGISEDKVVVIPGGIDTRTYNPNVDGSDIKRKYAPNCPLIVFAKPLYSVNTESAKLLVQTVALLKPKLKIKLLVGGGEGKKKVEWLAKDLGVVEQVDFMPPTPFPKIPRYIAAADLIVLPFIYAPTTSRSLLEAMAVGKPIITTPVGEIGRMLEDKKDALFIEPNPNDIANAIREILKNKKLSRLLSVNALSKVKKNFSLTLVVEQTISEFKNLLG